MPNDVFSLFPIGTIFQKKENGNIVAMTPDGRTTVVEATPAIRWNCLLCGGLVDLSNPTKPVRRTDAPDDGAMRGKS